MKTTYKQLEDKIHHLNNMLQMPLNQEFAICTINGKFQLVQQYGQSQIEVTSMGTKNEIYNIIQGMMYVVRMPNVQIGTLAQLESKIIKQQNINTITQGIKTL